VRAVAQAAVLSVAAPAALLFLATPPSPAPNRIPASADQIEQAVRIAHEQAKEAGGRPGPIS
jgi:hypothetical protein